MESSWPGARVVGQLADKPGYLVKIACKRMDTNQLGKLQDTLIALGCTGWNWSYESGCMTVRAYVLQRTRCAQGIAQVVLWAAALTTLATFALYLYNDIRIAKIVGF